MTRGVRSSASTLPRGLSLDGPPTFTTTMSRSRRRRHTSAVLARRAPDDDYDVAYNILAVVNRYSSGYAREIYQYFRVNGWDYLQFIPASSSTGYGGVG